MSNVRILRARAAQIDAHYAQLQARAEARLKASRCAAMTASEAEVYDRARATWIRIGQARRSEPTISRTFGASVESHQLLSARVVAFLAALLKSLSGAP